MSPVIPQRRDGKLGDIDGDFPLDESIIARKAFTVRHVFPSQETDETLGYSVLPSDGTILAATSHGESAWTRTG